MTIAELAERVSRAVLDEMRSPMRAELTIGTSVDCAAYGLGANDTITIVITVPRADGGDSDETRRG